MKLTRRRLLALVSALGIALAFMIGAGQPAHASQVQICGNNGTGYCLNDWNGGGNGNAVKMEYGGYSHEDFVAVQVTDWCNNGRVDANTNCPFSHSAFNQEFNNDVIVQIQYSNGYCIGANSTEDAVLGLCPQNNASAGIGTVMIEPSSPCGSGVGNGPSTYLIDRYVTDADDGVSYLRSGGNPGVQAYYSATATCWGAG